MERFWDSRPERVRAPYTKTEEDEQAKYYPVTDSVQYREGKVKRTPGGE